MNLDILLKEGFLKNVEKNAKYFNSKLKKLENKYPKIIKEIRGRGLLIGLKISVNQDTFIKKLLDKKLLTIRAAENVVRILPPLNVKKIEIDHAVTIIEKICKTYK